MNLAGLTSLWLKLTPQSCYHPNPRSNSLKVELRKGLGRGFGSSKGCCVHGGHQQMKEGPRGYIYPIPKSQPLLCRLCVCRNFRHSVGSFDLVKIVRLRTPHRKIHGTSNGGRNQQKLQEPKLQVSDLCLSCVVSISSSHFGISQQSFCISLKSTVFPIIKFKIEIYKRSSMKLKHRFFSKFGILYCSFQYQ